MRVSSQPSRLELTLGSWALAGPPFKAAVRAHVRCPPCFWHSAHARCPPCSWHSAHALFLALKWCTRVSVYGCICT